MTSAGEASADTTTISYATVTLDPGAGPGYVARLWAPHDTVTIQQPSPGTLSVSASGTETMADFSFAAPSGQTLAVGHYASAVEPGTERPGDASIHVSVCGTVSSGSFDVRDVDLTTGAERIDVVYDVNCDGQSAEGEVAVNEPSAVADVLTVPQTVGFPATYPTKTSNSRALTYVNSGSTILHPSGVQLTGSEPSRFHVASDGCTGHAVAPGGSCTVGVTFAPATGDPATDTVSLVIADDSAEGSQTVSLTGTPVPGYNEAYIIGDIGDSVVGSYKYQPVAPANALDASGTVDGVTVGGSVPGSSQGWSISLLPPGGQTLGVGTYSSGAGIEVHAPAPAHDSVLGYCSSNETGSFTISQFDVGPSGRLLALSLTWEDHCGGATAGNYGSVAWRASAAAQPTPTGPGSPADTTAPRSVQYLLAGGGYGSTTVSWLNPPDADLAHVIVRMASGLTPPATPTSGTGVYSGTGRSVVVTHLSLGHSYSFSAWAEDSRGNLSGAMTAVDHGTRTLFSVPKIVPVSVPFDATARVLDVDTGRPLYGLTVRFYARQPGATTWTFLGKAVTYNQGIAHISLRVTGHPYLEAQFLGGGQRGGSVSAAAHPTTAIGLLAHYTGDITSGSTEKFYGTVYPNLAGHRIYLERHTSSGWAIAASTLVTRSSTFSIAVRLASGMYTFRLIMGATNGYAGVVTNSVSVEVF